MSNKKTNTGLKKIFFNPFQISPAFTGSLVLKFALTIALLSLTAILLLGCDSGSQTYDVEVKVNIPGPELSEEELEKVAQDLEAFVLGTDGVVSTYFTVEEGQIIGELRDLRDEVNVGIRHSFYGEDFRYLTPNFSGSKVEFDLDGRNSVIKLEVEQKEILQIMDNDTIVYRLKPLELPDIEVIENLAFLDNRGNQNYKIGEIGLEEHFYAAALEDETAEFTLALLAENGDIIATSEIELDESGKKEVELDFTLQGAEIDNEIASKEKIATTDSLSGDEYLASYTLTIDDLKNGIFQEENGEGMAQGRVPLKDNDNNFRVMNSEADFEKINSYLMINHFAVDLDFVIEEQDEFEEILLEEARRIGYDLDDLEIYLKTHTAELSDLELNSVDNPDEFKMNLQEVITSDGARHDLPQALVEVNKTDIIDYYNEGKIPYYTIAVQEVNAVAGARSFTIQRPDNSPQSWGDEITRDVINTDDDNFPMDIFVLGTPPDEPGWDEDERIYRVSEAYQLRDILQDYQGEDSRGLTIQLIQDIDLAELDSWEPVGSSAQPFKGTLDGFNYEIRNLEILDGDSDVGLFAYLGENAVVKDINFTNISVEGDKYVGSVAGRSKGAVENINFAGEVNVFGSDQYIGGVVGLQLEGGRNNHLKNIDFRGEVTATEVGEYIGGLAGASYADILADDEHLINRPGSSVTDSEINGYRWVGGVTGYNAAGSIEDIIVAANVSGQREIGGLVGKNEAEIKSSSFGSFADSSVSGESIADNSKKIGGLVGLNERGGYIENSYAGSEGQEASITGFNGVGGLVGENWATVEFTENGESYVDVTGEDNNIGGMIGHIQDGEVSIPYHIDKWIEGHVEGRKRVGGFAGRSNIAADNLPYVDEFLQNSALDIPDVGEEEIDHFIGYWISQ